MCLSSVPCIASLSSVLLCSHKHCSLSAETLTAPFWYQMNLFRPLCDHSPAVLYQQAVGGSSCDFAFFLCSLSYNKNTNAGFYEVLRVQPWFCLEIGLDAEKLSARSSSDCAPETLGLCDCFHISLALRYSLCSQPRLPAGAPETFHVPTSYFFGISFFQT